MTTVWCGAAEMRRAPVACSPSERTFTTRRAPMSAEKAPNASFPMAWAVMTM